MTARRTWMNFALAAPFALGACAVGPDYRAPKTQMPKSWSSSAPARSASESATPASSAELAHWWTLFRDPHLDSLVEGALAANLDLRGAAARIRQARAARVVAGAAQAPTIDLSASATRSGSSNSSTQDLYRAGFDASWELDLFGGVRRGVEAADADLASTIDDARALRVSLVAEVTVDYFEYLTVALELSIARENLVAQRESIELSRQRYEAGFVSALDVRSAEALAASTTARIPALESELRTAEIALALLLARQPEDSQGELSIDAKLPAVLPDVPLGLPSELLRRRPDIRKAEADLHGATARIGIAESDLFPKFSLDGTLGFAGDHLGALGNVDDRFWSFGPSLSLPLFNAGRLRANLEEQRALADQSFVLYQKAVLTALADVETALYSYTKERERRAALADSLRAEQAAADLARELYTAGRTDFSNVISADRQRLDAQDSLAQSDRQIIDDLVALYKALGGGWDFEPDRE